MKLRSIKRHFRGGWGNLRRLIAPIGGCACLTALLVVAACTVTVNPYVHCSLTSLSCEGGIKVIFAEANVRAKGVQPLDVSNTYTAFTTQNVTMTDGTYSTVVGIYDANNNLVASHNFNFYVTGNTAYFSNPAAVQDWVNAHEADGSYIRINYSSLPFSVTDPNAPSGKVTQTTYNDGQQIASATSYFKIKGGGVCRPPSCDPEPNTSTGK